MAIVFQLTHRFAARPEPLELAGITVRHYVDHSDIERWLTIRQRAFAQLPLGVGAWTAADFEREFLSKWWWQADRLWFAETGSAANESAQIIGTVCLAMRGNEQSAKPVVHWLAVLPRWRRRGVARLLMNVLETACWDAGYHQVWLETHPAWTAASAFYQAAGYLPVTTGD